MSDLISRSAVIDIIHKYCCNTARIEENVLDLPNAYDVEKVVKQLEEERERNLNGWKDATNIFALTKYGHSFSAYVKAIDIVKNGGTDLGYNPYQE